MNNLLLCFVPFVTYWVTCGISGILFKRHYEKEKIMNSVTSNNVLKNVLGVTALATLGNFALYYFNFLDQEKFRFLYVLLGIWWIDTVEYFVHFTMHKIPFLYRLAHKEHHRLNIPYHYGALYNSSYEANITGSILTLGFVLLKFSFSEFILVTSLANIATVIDHIDFKDYSSSNSIIKFISKNNFHYIHHNSYQNSNFQQPFFTYYDRIFGTYKI